MYKLAISNIAWDETQADGMYTLLKQQGVALEIAPPKVIKRYPNYEALQVQQFRHYIDDTYHLPIISLQSILFGESAELFRSDQEYEIIFKQVQRAIECANLLACRNVVFGSPKNRNLFKADDKEKGVRFFRALGEFALEHNTILAIEANPKIYGTNYINTTEEAFELAKIVNCQGLQVNVDLGTIIENNESLSTLVQNKDYINHVHISEPYLEKIMNRDIHKKLASTLQRIDYDKYISIEMKQQNQTEILKSIQYVKEVFYGV